MTLTSIFGATASFYALAPSGRQIGKAAKEILKEAPKYADDVVRVATKNKGFLSSVPVWVWVIIGIVVVAGAIYYFVEES